jgi:hypothetical protein
LQGNAAVECLRIGIGGDEVNAIDAFADHVIDGIATGATDADDLDHRISFAALFYLIDDFKHCRLLCKKPLFTAESC